MSDATQRILYVDDEPNYAKFYVKKLEELYDVTYVEEADKALAILSEQAGQFAAVVLDIMMPVPPGASDDETDSGFETGLWLLDMFQRSGNRQYPFPVVILTNRRVDLIQAGMERRQLDSRAISIHRKIETPAFALPKLIKSAIASHAG